MTFAVIDNGSLAPAAHELLRSVAIALSSPAPVHPVSWKHSDRVVLADGTVPWTVKAWVRSQCAAGEREFVFVPFFISPAGAIGDALRRDLQTLQAELPFTFRFTPGLSPDSLAEILQDLITAAQPSPATHVIVVDHGGPSAASASIRDAVAALLRRSLGARVRSVAAASMESPDDKAEGEFAFNAPLFAAALQDLPAGAPVLVAPLFLAPGRHAGPNGDLAALAASAARGPCRFVSPLGGHPVAVATLARALLPFVSVIA